MKVVINRKFGGFGISNEAFERLIALGWTVTRFTENGEYDDPSANLVDMSSSKWTLPSWDPGYGFTSGKSSKELRTNADLIRVVEELGERANTRFSELKIVSVPDDVSWDIDDYDGMETIEEVHRTWF